MDKRCEICNKLLSGKQQRFCSRRCRNVSAGRVSVSRYKIPDKEWLASEYLLPPDGKGCSLPELAKIFGVSAVTVGNWVSHYGLTQSPNERLSHFAKRPNPKRRSPMPPRDEFASHYLMPPDGKGMSQDELAKHYGVSRPTITRWLTEFELLQPFPERHSARMSGDGNPAYLNGNSHRFVLHSLTKVKPKVCEWCGTTEKVQVHHIDHDHGNNELDNLMWLCGPCNRLEAQLWQLEQLGRAERSITDNQLVITFRRLRNGRLH